jgi:hypothetical protein
MLIRDPGWKQFGSAILQSRNLSRNKLLRFHNTGLNSILLWSGSITGSEKKIWNRCLFGDWSFKS